MDEKKTMAKALGFETYQALETRAWYGHRGGKDEALIILARGYIVARLAKTAQPEGLVDIARDFAEED